MSYDKIYRINARELWANTVYDEYGNSVVCDFCGEELIWEAGDYRCPSCGRTMSRSDFMNYIAADPPGTECLICRENYPLCKRWCTVYEIDPDDPLLN